MTTLDTAGPVRHAPSALGRIVNVLRLHFTNPATIVTTPLFILAIIFAVNWAIWWLIALSVPVTEQAGAAEGTQWSGASFFIFVYMMVVAVQAMNLTFPLALGYGATRRDYYLGSALTFVVLSAGWSVLLGVLGLIEEATNGWGLGGTMFTSIYFGADGPWLRLWYFFVLLLFFFFTGAAVATLYVRWKQYGLIGYFTVLAVLVVGGIALIVLTDSWGAIGEFFATIGFTGAYSLSLVPTAISAVAGFLLLRGATPRG